jgi:hypothetical protein
LMKRFKLCQSVPSREKLPPEVGDAKEDNPSAGWSSCPSEDNLSAALRSRVCGTDSLSVPLLFCHFLLLAEEIKPATLQVCEGQI